MITSAGGERMNDLDEVNALRRSTDIERIAKLEIRMDIQAEAIKQLENLTKRIADYQEKSSKTLASIRYLVIGGIVTFVGMSSGLDKALPYLWKLLFIL